MTIKDKPLPTQVGCDFAVLAKHVDGEGLLKDDPASDEPQSIYNYGDTRSTDFHITFDVAISAS